MSLIKTIADITKSQETLLFKNFEPRIPQMSFAELTNEGECGSDSCSFTDGSQSPASPKLIFPCTSQSLTPNVFNFDLTGYRGPPAKPGSRARSTDLLESPSPNMFQLTAAATNQMGVFSGDPNLPKRLHVSNIPFRYREHNLVMLFAKFGNVEDAEIIYNDKGSKGFGFVTMSRGRDADNARITLNQAIVEGRIIEVNLATPKVVGLKKTSVDVGSPSEVPAGFSGSSEALIEAEMKLAQAKMEVLRLRKQMQLFNYTEADTFY